MSIELTKQLSLEDQDTALNLLWTYMVMAEGVAKPGIERHEVECTCNFFNRIGYSQYRPRWEKKNDDSS